MKIYYLPNIDVWSKISLFGHTTLLKHPCTSQVIMHIFPIANASGNASTFIFSSYHGIILHILIITAIMGAKDRFQTLSGATSNMTIRGARPKGAKEFDIQWMCSIWMRTCVCRLTWTMGKVLISEDHSDC